jgi:hypothetical protein
MRQHLSLKFIKCLINFFLGVSIVDENIEKCITVLKSVVPFQMTTPEGSSTNGHTSELLPLSSLQEALARSVAFENFQVSSRIDPRIRGFLQMV